MLLKNSNLLSTLSNRCMRYMSKHRHYQEIQIPVPWGYIAGKWWGPEDRRPILTLHGWQDNCGTFDRLMPYLPHEIPMLAIDFPGHGHSSQIPSGMAYYNVNATILIKRLMQYFGWKKITLMGHSLGAINSYTYGFLFPEEVDYIICIDGLHPLINPLKYARIARSIEQFIKYDILNNSLDEPPSYEYKEMEQKLHEASNKSVDLQSAKYLLARNIHPSKHNPGKFYFKRDARLKIGPLEAHDPPELIKSASNIKFPIFISKAELSPFFGNETIFGEVHEVLKKSSADCQFYDVPGTHHVHLNQPEIVEGLINRFIEKHEHTDRSYGGIKQEIKVSDDVYDVRIEELERKTQQNI